MKRRPPTRTTERQLPYDEEAEFGVIGCALLKPVECVPEIASRISGVDAFFDERMKAMWELLLSMHERGEAIDMITVISRLAQAKQLDAVGGRAFIAGLPDSVPSAANLDHYLRILLEAHAARNTVQICTAAIESVFSGTAGATALSHLECDILQLTDRRDGWTGSWDVKGAVKTAIKEIEALTVNVGRTAGIPTGFIDFDKMTGGLQNEQMIVIAGRPSVGKSSWALNVADYIAVGQKIPVGYFSFEMSQPALVKRAISARSRVNLRWLRDGFGNDETMEKLSRASGQIAGAPLYIDDQPSQNIVQVRAKMRRMVQKHGIRLGIVDYLQLLHGYPGKRYRSDQEELADISTALKELARELKIPVLVLSQLNRDVEKERKSRKPRMSDLKGSGNLEQDADLIGLLYRASRENRHKPDEDDGEHRGDPVAPVNMLVDKQRDGETGEIHFTFLKSLTRFELAAKIANDDVEQAEMQYQPPSKDP